MNVQKYCQRVREMLAHNPLYKTDCKDIPVMCADCFCLVDNSSIKKVKEVTAYMVVAFEDKYNHCYYCGIVYPPVSEFPIDKTT